MLTHRLFDEVFPEKTLFLHSIDSKQNEKAIKFFDAVAAEVTGGETLKDKVQIIIVVHAYEATLPMIQSLSKTFTIGGIIFKNSTVSLRPEYAQCLRDAGYPVLDLEKSDFVNGNSHKTVHKILSHLDPNKKTIIMEHGGYFAQQGGILLSFPEFRKNLIAIIEYAANGEERWRRIPNRLLPIVSIGRSEIKEASDIGSAESIVHGAIAFFKTHNFPLTPRTKIGVIGCGRLGGGIKDSLATNTDAQVLVNDTDQLKMASIRNAVVTPKVYLLRESDVIFCATGSKAIPPEDFKLIKEGALIFTVTSPDDELGLEELVSLKVLTKEPKPIGKAYGYKVNGTEKNLFGEIDLQSLRDLGVITVENKERGFVCKIAGTDKVLFDDKSFEKLRSEGVLISQETSSGTLTFKLGNEDKKLFDDQDLKGLAARGLIKDNGQGYDYKVKGSEKRIFFPYDGDSPNIIFPCFIDPTILQPYALHILTTIKAVEHEKDLVPGEVQAASRHYEATVGRIYNKIYNPEPT